MMTKWGTTIKRFGYEFRIYEILSWSNDLSHLVLGPQSLIAIARLCKLIVIKLTMNNVQNILKCDQF